MLFSPLTVLLLGTSSVTLALPQDDQNLRQAISALRPQLSKEAIVTFPWNPRWNELQIRASSPRVHPAYNVVVEIASEADVQATVTLANRYNVPFLAISGSHGWTRTLNKLSHGIQINLRKLNTTLLNDTGKTAHVGGGTLQYEITRSLFDKGKYAGMACHYSLVRCVDLS